MKDLGRHEAEVSISWDKKEECVTVYSGRGRTVYEREDGSGKSTEKLRMRNTKQERSHIFMPGFG